MAFALAYRALDDGSATVPANWPPVADAGNDQMVGPGASVTLDASGSTDPDGDVLTYSWEQPAGPTVTLSSTTAANPTFTAPSTPTTLTFRVKVTDSRGGTDTDTVTIRVNRPPVANAGPTQTVDAGATVMLDGTGSRDPLTYSWEELPGVGGGVTLSSSSSSRPTFTAPSGPAALTFELTVTDGRGGSDSDTVSITVRASSDQG